MPKKTKVLSDRYKSTTKIYPKVIMDSLTPEVREYIESQGGGSNAFRYYDGDYTGSVVPYDLTKLIPSSDIQEGDIVLFKNGYIAQIYTIYVELNSFVIINDIKLNVGGQLYQHRIDFYNDNMICHLDIINDSQTAFTKSTFKQYLSDNIGRFCANGYSGTATSVNFVIKFIRFSNNAINVSGFSSSWVWTNYNDIDTIFFDNTTTFTDTIIAL